MLEQERHLVAFFLRRRHRRANRRLGIARRHAGDPVELVEADVHRAEQLDGAALRRNRARRPPAFHRDALDLGVDIGVRGPGR